MRSMRLALLALSLALLAQSSLASLAAATAPPANIYAWSADFVTEIDWYQTNITLGRVFMDYSSSANTTNALWAGANGLNKIEMCGSGDDSTFGYYGQGQCSRMSCVRGRCGKSYCSCRAPCDAFAMLCSLQTARYSGSCKVGGVVGDLWTVVDAVAVCMADQGRVPLGIVIYGNEVVVRFTNFRPVVPASTWQLPSYCQGQCAVRPTGQ